MNQPPSLRGQKNDPFAYRETMRGIIGWSVSEQLHRIECPMLVIAGQKLIAPQLMKGRFLQARPKG